MYNDIWHEFLSYVEEVIYFIEFSIFLFSYEL